MRLYCVLKIIEPAKIGFLSANPDLRPPLAPLFVEDDARMTTGIVLPQPYVTHVLRLIANSEVLPPIICPVPVNVVNVVERLFSSHIDKGKPMRPIQSAKQTDLNIAVT